jgi:hypothetical protein
LAPALKQQLTLPAEFRSGVAWISRVKALDDVTHFLDFATAHLKGAAEHSA